MNQTHRTGPYTRFVLGVTAVLLAGCQLPVQPQPGSFAHADTHFVTSTRTRAPVSPPGESVVALSDDPDLDEYRAFARQVETNEQRICS